MTKEVLTARATLYECDPEKNTHCRKSLNCKVTGGQCHQTHRKEFELVEVKIVLTKQDAIYLRSVLKDTVELWENMHAMTEEEEVEMENETANIERVSKIIGDQVTTQTEV